MNLYWIYDLENWQFYLICITTFCLFCLSGSLLFNKFLEKKLNLKKQHNNIIAIFLGLSGVIYGITLGLIAVATFENFNTVDSIVANESSSLAALYSDTDLLAKNNEKDKLKTILKNYTNYVVKEAWPLQSQGITPKKGTTFIMEYQKILGLYEPKTRKDEIIYAQTFNQYNQFIEKRRLRLNAVTVNLPSSIWAVLLIGAIVNIIFTWLLVIRNQKLDFIINTLMGILLGTLVFLIAIMDNPFRGKYCVSSDSFQILLETIMKN